MTDTPIAADQQQEQRPEDDTEIIIKTEINMEEKYASEKRAEYQNRDIFLKQPQTILDTCCCHGSSAYYQIVKNQECQWPSSTASSWRQLNDLVLVLCDSM